MCRGVDEKAKYEELDRKELDRKELDRNEPTYGAMGLCRYEAKGTLYRAF